MIPLNTTRTNVYDSREGRVRGLLFGASPGRGPQVAKAGFEHKMLLLVGNHMPLLALHTDGRNCGRSYTMSFGNFEGGKLMLHNPSKHSE
eukprot:3590896-Amphidinium_carterae.2